jgi:predicted DNA-binding ribbon-helix-helix protein
VIKGHNGSNPQELRKHSVVIAGHATSVSLETAFWTALKRIAATRGQSLNALITEIDKTRSGNLSSALRVYILDWLEQRPGGNEFG